MQSIQIQASSTIVPAAIFQEDQPEPAPPTSSLALDTSERLYVGKTLIAMVSSILMDGYRAARKAYAAMEKEEEDGAFFLLTGYEYTHLGRRYLPAGLSPVEQKEWQRGFLAGWNAATFEL